jgi:hypothetical protein
LLAAWAILGGNQGRAEYVSVGVTSHPGGTEDARSLLAGMPRSWQDCSDLADGGTTGPPLPADGPSKNERPNSPLLSRNLLPDLQTQSGGASSSGISSPSGPSSPAVGLIERPDIPQEELVRRLDAEADSWNLVSLTSRLFRPPRATL